MNIRRIKTFALSACAAATFAMLAPQQAHARMHAGEFDPRVEAERAKLIAIIDLQVQRIEDAYAKLINFENFAKDKKLAGDGQDHDSTISKDIKDIRNFLEKFSTLVNDAVYFDIPEFGLVPNGTKCFVTGEIIETSGNTVKIRQGGTSTTANDAIILTLEGYQDKQYSSDAVVVAYGSKVGNLHLSCDVSYYAVVVKSTFVAQADRYPQTYNLPHVAAHYYFAEILPNLHFEREFNNLKDDIDAHYRYLEQVTASDGVTFKQWLDGTPPPPPQPPAIKCGVCGWVLPESGICPNAANHPGAKAGFSKYIPLVAVAVIIILVIVLVIAFVGNKGGSKIEDSDRRPYEPQPQPQPEVAKPTVAPAPQPTSPPPPACPRCGAALDAMGICPECTRIPDKPVSFHNFDEDATRVPAAFDLEIMAPAKWAGKYADRLPAKFEMGRYSEKQLPAPGTPFCALNLEGHPDASSCSRRYLRFSMTAGKDGFNVDLLADNYCKVAGTVLRKGENAVAKLGDEISIAPDWTFKVVPRK